MQIILASKSPRRNELLKRIFSDFKIIVSEKEEIINTAIPEEAVVSLSRQKAEDVYDMIKESLKEDTLIIGADTVVAINNKILGKPIDREDAYNILEGLSGNTHSVFTGVTLILIKNGEIHIDSFYEETKVLMYEISKEEIIEYIDSNEPMDKAGAYGIQGIGGKFVKRIEGDYNNVVGLPIARIYQELKK